MNGHFLVIRRHIQHKDEPIFDKHGNSAFNVICPCDVIYQKCAILEPSSTYHWTAFINIQANNCDIQLTFHELSAAQRSTYLYTNLQLILSKLQVNNYLYFLARDTLRKWKLMFIPLSKPWMKPETYFINEFDLKLRFTIDIQVVCQKSQTNKDKNKKLVLTDDWLDKICPKSSMKLLENLDKQISEEINLLKESKARENLKKLIGRPIIAMALDHPVLKRNN